MLPQSHWVSLDESKQVIFGDCGDRVHKVSHSFGANWLEGRIRTLEEGVVRKAMSRTDENSTVPRGAPGRVFTLHKSAPR